MSQESITITIPSSIVNEHLPLLIEKLCHMNVNVNYDKSKNDTIKDIVAHLYVDCQLSKEVSTKLLTCLSNNSYQAFIKFLSWVEQYEDSHCIILEYLSQRVDAGTYASIVEDDDFNQQLVDALLNIDDDIQDILRSYNNAKHHTTPSLSPSSSPVDTPRKNDASNTVGEKVNVDESNMEKAKNIASNMDNEKFESILQSLGLDEAGLTKARKIKADVESGQQLNMVEIMSFILVEHLE